MRRVCGIHSTGRSVKPIAPTGGSVKQRRLDCERRASTDNPVRSLRPLTELLRQLGFIITAVLLYFGVRGLTEGEVDIAVENGLRVLAFEARLGIDIEQWAQGLIIDSQKLITVANGIYIWGHWPVIAVTLVWLHRTRRYEFLLLRNAMFISGAVGLVIFATYAVAPPRLLDVGLFDTVTQHSDAYRILQPPALVNKYAAIPSLHVGWNLLVGIALYRSARGRSLRAFAVLSPVLMAVAVVVTANHYFVDGILGSVLALIGLAVSGVVTPRLIELDAWFRQRHQHVELIDDQPIDSPADQPSSNALVPDRPAEHQAVSVSQLCHQTGGEQPSMDDNSIEGDS